MSLLSKKQVNCLRVCSSNPSQFTGTKSATTSSLKQLGQRERWRLGERRRDREIERVGKERGDKEIERRGKRERQRYRERGETEK